MALWSLLNNNVFDNAVYQSNLKQKLQTVHYNINFNTLGQLDQAHWATVGFALPIELPRDTITSVQSVARCMSSYTIQIKSMTRFTKFTWLPNHIPITNITESIFIKYYLQFFFIVLVINSEVSKSVNSNQLCKCKILNEFKFLSIPFLSRFQIHQKCYKFSLQ